MPRNKIYKHLDNLKVFLRIVWWGKVRKNMIVQFWNWPPRFTLMTNRVYQKRGYIVFCNVQNGMLYILYFSKCSISLLLFKKTSLMCLSAALLHFRGAKYVTERICCKLNPCVFMRSSGGLVSLVSLKYIQADHTSSESVLMTVQTNLLENENYYLCNIGFETARRILC